jgi:predicted mannosyl-3-phosphoglycerate phosphatase (HAD superfamily)
LFRYNPLGMRSSTTVVYCAVDNLISLTGKPLLGFRDFLDQLSNEGIPCVWVTVRNRLQLDSTLRRLAHAEPFIAEAGSGVFLPEDYFHLRPARTIRIGRFTCIPVASLQPAAAEALEQLAEEAGIDVVPVRTLSHRELAQNTGLEPRETDLFRQRDFEELFFFAGASDADIRRFLSKATKRKFSVRPLGTLWSIAVGRSIGTCVRELSTLYDRAMKARAFSIAIASADEAGDLFPACHRSILLSDRSHATEHHTATPGRARTSFPLFSRDTWDTVLDVVRLRRF